MENEMHVNYTGRVWACLQIEWQKEPNAKPNSFGHLLDGCENYMG